MAATQPANFDLATVQPNHHLGVLYMADASLQRAADAIQALPKANVEHVQPIAAGHNLVFISNFDPMHCAIAYGAFADRICRFGGYYALQHAASSRTALEDGLRRVIQTQQPSSCRLFAYPAALRKELLATLPDQPDFACLQPHNTTHNLSVFQVAPDLFLYGCQPIEHTLVWFDAPGAHLKSPVQLEDSVSPQDPAPEGPVSAKDSVLAADSPAPTTAPSEQAPRPKRSGGLANSDMVFNQTSRVCRAAIKLREVFDGRLQPFLLPEGCVAVDVGAAPGGWTDVSC